MLYFRGILIILLFLSFPKVALSGDLLSLLKDQPLIHNEGPYGYPTNDLYLNEGCLVRTKDQSQYTYFEDSPLTDVERFLLAINKSEFARFGFERAHDQDQPSWAGFCHQTTAASIHPRIHRMMGSTNGLICPTESGKAVILNKMTLRELIGYFFRFEKAAYFGQGLEQSVRQGNPTNRSLLFEEDTLDNSLKAHIFHLQGHSRLKDRQNFIINIGPPGTILNRAVKSMTSKQTLIHDSSCLEQLSVPATPFPDRKLVYHIESVLSFFSSVEFHENGNTTQWNLEYLIFIDPTHSDRIDSIWIDPKSSTLFVEGLAYPSNYFSSRPNLIWYPQWNMQDPSNEAGLSTNGISVIQSLFKRCTQLDQAEQWVREVELEVDSLNQLSFYNRWLQKKQLRKQYSKIEWLPLKDELRIKFKSAL